jgi:hypothetical protein
VSEPCGWCEAEPCECTNLARPCYLCGLPCVRIGGGEPNTLIIGTDDKVYVVHSRCKRKVLASVHAGRERARRKGPRLA